MKPLIVGIDPGTTSAAAGVDFDGDLEFLFSERHISTSELIERIIENGRPVIITSDRAKTPSKVSKIASSLGAELYEPKKDLSQDDKSEMGSGDNYHEIDASAAAFNAFNNSKKEIRKIKEIASSKDKDLLEASRIYYGDFPIEKSKSETSVEEEEEIQEEPESTETIETRLRRKIDRLETEIEGLKEEKDEALKQNSELESRIEKLRQKNREDIKSEELRRKNSVIDSKNREIKNLESSVENSRKIIRAYRKGLRMLFEGSELIPIADERDEVEEKAAFRSEDVIEDPKFEDIELLDVEEIKGLELKEFIIAEKFPEKNFEDIIRDYKDSR